MKLLRLALPILVAVHLCGCESTKPLAQSPPLPPKVTEEQHRIITDVQLSLTHRRWTFNDLLARSGHPAYFRRRAERSFGGVIEGTMAKSFAPGISEHDLTRVDAHEYAFFSGAMTNPHTHESIYWRWRVSVRNGQVIYMEFAPVTEASFFAYVEKV